MEVGEAILAAGAGERPTSFEQLSAAIDASPSLCGCQPWYSVCMSCIVGVAKSRAVLPPARRQQMQRIANRSIAICLVAMFVSAVREAQANRLSVPASACAPADITVAAKRLHIDEGGWVFRVDQMGSDITVVCPVSNWIFLQDTLYSLTVWYRDTDGRGLNSKVMKQME